MNSRSACRRIWTRWRVEFYALRDASQRQYCVTFNAGANHASRIQEKYKHWRGYRNRLADRRQGSIQRWNGRNWVYRTPGRGNHFHLGLRPIRQSQGLFTLVWIARTLEYSRPYCTRVLSGQAQRGVTTRTAV